MNKDILKLCILAAFITKDDFINIEESIIRLKKSRIDPAKIYETILQTYLFCGFPVVIESLKLFKKHYAEFKINYHKYDLNKYKSLGEINCKLIYKNNYKKLISNMAFVSPELKKWMIIEGYGKVLGRKALSLNYRELINVSILTVRYFESQLHSHIKGCLNLNIRKKELQELLSALEPIAGKRNYSRALNLLIRLSKSV